MNRSQTYIWLNILLLLVGGLVFFYSTKKFRVNDQVKLVNSDKEGRFRQEAIVLDSLYKTYVAAMETNDQMTVAGASAQFEKQVALMKKEYTGTAAPAVLSSKLIRNYQVRVILNEHLRKRKNLQSGETNRIKMLITKLEEQNTELKTQNQMIKQVLLGLP